MTISFLISHSWLIEKNTTPAQLNSFSVSSNRWFWEFTLVFWSFVFLFDCDAIFWASVTSFLMSSITLKYNFLFFCYSLLKTRSWLTLCSALSFNLSGRCLTLSLSRSAIASIFLISAASLLLFRVSPSCRWFVQSVPFCSRRAPGSLFCLTALW